MYPEGELTELARAKAALRRSIGHRRAQCAEAAAGASRPLAWLDSALDLWRRFAPFVAFAAGPLGRGAGAAFPRRKILGTLFRWAPAIFRAVSAFRRMRRPAPTSETPP
jgi:hypothetical protein